MAVEMVLRKMGNSLGATFPKEIVEKMQLKEGDKVVVQVTKIADLTEIFGTMKFKKTAQQMKDESRKRWM